jgi:hypothetical protein
MPQATHHEAKVRNNVPFPGYVLRIYREDGFDDWVVAVSNPGVAKMVVLDAAGLPQDYPRIRVEDFLTTYELERLKLEPGQARKKSLAMPGSSAFQNTSRRW